MQASAIKEYISIDWYIIKAQDIKDIVSVYKAYREKLLRTKPSEHSVTVEGVEFTPRTESLQANYSNSLDVYNSYHSSNTASVVIGCLAAVVGIIVLIVIIYMVVSIPYVFSPGGAILP